MCMVQQQAATNGSHLSFVPELESKSGARGHGHGVFCSVGGWAMVGDDRRWWWLVAGSPQSASKSNRSEKEPVAMALAMSSLANSISLSFRCFLASGCNDVLLVQLSNSYQPVPLKKKN